MYPGWRIRIYHNVTRENEEVHLSIFVFMAFNFALLQVWEKFCQYFCGDNHVQKNVIVGAIWLTHRRGMDFLQNVYKSHYTASYKSARAQNARIRL